MAYSIFDSIIPVEQLTHQEPTLHHHVLVSILSYSGVTDTIILRFFQKREREDIQFSKPFYHRPKRKISQTGEFGSTTPAHARDQSITYSNQPYSHVSDQ